MSQGRIRSFLNSNAWRVVQLVAAVLGAASTGRPPWVRVGWLVFGALIAWDLVGDLVRRRKQRVAGVADVRD
jgi:hypothetical protein